MAECLINTMNRQNNSMANLFLIMGGLPAVLIICILKEGADRLYRVSSWRLFGTEPYFELFRRQ